MQFYQPALSYDVGSIEGTGMFVLSISLDDIGGNDSLEHGPSGGMQLEPACVGNEKEHTLPPDHRFIDHGGLAGHAPGVEFLIVADGIGGEVSSNSTGSHYGCCAKEDRNFGIGGQIRLHSREPRRNVCPAVGQLQPAWRVLFLRPPGQPCIEGR